MSSGRYTDEDTDDVVDILVCFDFVEGVRKEVFIVVVVVVVVAVVVVVVLVVVVVVVVVVAVVVVVDDSFL